MPLFSRRPKPPLSVELLRFSRKSADAFTVEDATKGVHVFGTIGSGKTSGAGRTLARAYLRHGMGGLVLTAKPEDVHDWLRFAEETGRSDDVILFGIEHAHRMNFLDYENNRPGGGSAENIADMFRSIVEIGRRGQAQNTGGNPFFDDAVMSVMRNGIELIRLSKQPVTLATIRDVMLSVPRGKEELQKLDKPPPGEEAAARAVIEQSTFFQLFDAIFTRVKSGDALSEDEAVEFTEVEKYWTQTYNPLAEETRSSIEATFDAMTSTLLKGPLRKLLSSDTTITPEVTFEGKIVIMDIDVLTHKRVGFYAQAIWKYLWQQALSARHFDRGREGPPAFLWSDESQHFITKDDAMFMTTARSGGACVVFLTQNIQNYEDAMGEHHRAGVQSLLANFNTKIFHLQDDPATNNYASDSIGRDVLHRAQTGRNTGVNSGTNDSTGGQGGSSGRNRGDNSGSSYNLTEQVDHILLPVKFSELRNGGPRNKFKVDAIIRQAGRTWKASKAPYIYVEFDQRK